MIDLTVNLCYEKLDEFITDITAKMESCDEKIEILTILNCARRDILDPALTDKNPSILVALARKVQVYAPRVLGYYESIPKPVTMKILRWLCECATISAVKHADEIIKHSPYKDATLYECSKKEYNDLVNNVVERTKTLNTKNLMVDVYKLGLAARDLTSDACTCVS